MSPRSDPATTSIRPSAGAQTSTAALSLRVFGSATFAVHALPAEGEVTLGRSQEATIAIDDPSVSRSHARLKIGRSVWIEDLGSANGTRIDGRALEPGNPVELEAGHVIELGSVFLVIQPPAAADRPRRFYSHGYFETRLEEECTGALEDRREFSIAQLEVRGAVRPQAIERLVAETTRATDLVASYSPSQYEVLYLGVSREDAEALLARTVAAFAEERIAVRSSLVSHPGDGRTAEALVAAAQRALRGVEEPGRAPLIVRESAMEQLYRIADRIAPGSLSVLLLGETGVGKEVMAEALHQRSPRRDKPLLKINCAAISEALLESELFGYAKGAFTGAQQTKTGLLESANGGTVFLDEVGELPLLLQSKILRVLEDRAILPIGCVKTRPIDVRFISATNRDLEAEIQRGTFRQDLFYRLGGISLLIPPLRERAGEIEPLARTFLEEASRSSGHVAPPELTGEALELLRGYRWPGNIRELKNTMERAVLLSGGEPITGEHLPRDKMRSVVLVPRKSSVATPPPGDPPAVAPKTTRLKETIDLVERERIARALEQCAGNQTRAAKLLGISRNTLLARLKAYGVPRPRA